MKGKWILAFLLFPMIFCLACASGHREPFPETQPIIRDLSLIESRLKKTVAYDVRFTMTVIGEVDYGVYKAPVWAISFVTRPEPKYRVFMCGGIHGNEPAGVEILVRTIESMATNILRYESIYFDIIPLINPWGWSHDVRFNRDGIDVNRDFASFKSQEAKIVREFLKGKRYDLIIDHHEDPNASGFYIYQYGNPDTLLSRRVIEVVRGLGYPIEQDVKMVILRTKDGLINAPLWGLWYMKLTKQLSMANYCRLNNSRKVYTVETPTSLALEDRVAIHGRVSSILLNSLSGGF